MLADHFTGVEVGEAATAPAAIEAISEREWDILLLDIKIPGQNGFEVLEHARRVKPETPVLVISGFPEEEFAVHSFKLGAAGYLNKSQAPEELIAAVNKALSGGKYVTPALAEKLAMVVQKNQLQLPHESLSARELQVLRMVAAGNTVKEIAAELHLSPKTVGTYRRRLAAKLGGGTNVELTRYALRHGLVE